MCMYHAATPVVDQRERIGDDERERASTELRAHFSAGRLDTDEFSARLEEVWAARTAGDLARAQRDLPHVQARVGESHRRTRLFLPVAAILLGVWLLTAPGRPFLPVWPLAVWATIVLLARHRRRAWGRAVSPREPVPR
jgi:hypothetical protein